VELAFHQIDDLREAVSQRLLNLNFREVGSDRFHCRIKPIIFTGQMRVVRWQHSAGGTFRDSRLIKDGDESVSLVYPVGSVITVSHLDQDRRLSSGEAALLRHDAVGEIGSKRDCSFVAVVLSPALLQQDRMLSDGVIARPLSDNLPALKLLKSYVALLSGRPQSLQNDIAASAAQHIVDLIRIAASESHEIRFEAEAGSVANARLEVALAYIRRAFRRPDLSVATVAHAQGISTRYMQKLLERSGIRFSDQVNEYRLNAAYEMLVDRKHPIADIAFASGFSDISYFNRLFKRRFDATPSAVRERPFMGDGDAQPQ
jgi:AraC-like DNA-binding protein